MKRIYQHGSVSFSGIADIRDSLKRLEIGSSLGTTELLRICKVLEVCNRVKSYSRNDHDPEELDSLDEMFSALQPLTPLSSEIRRCILSEEEISDDASSALRQIRRSMKLVHEKVRAQLNAIVNGPSRTYLQDAVITMRNDRYCIPVKAEYAVRFPA